MDCVCPNCGKKIPSGEYCFDLTEFIKNWLISLTSTVVSAADDLDEIKDGLESFFNGWGEKQPLLFSENELWSMEDMPYESRNMDDRNIRNIIFLLPATRVLSQMNKDLNEKSSEKMLKLARGWVGNNESRLSTTASVLQLRKRADGDIRFDLIIDGKSNTPITGKRQCPYCRKVLSYWAGRYPEICLGVLGGPRVSKTTTLTACASVFIDNSGSINWEGSSMDDFYKEFEKIYLKSYRDCDPILATQPIKDKVPRLTFKVTAEKRIFALTFVDLPGEFNNENGLKNELYQQYSDFFENIDFVWYCTDPGEIVQLSETAKESEKVRELGYGDQNKVMPVSEIKTNMRAYSPFFMKNTRKIPVAYILGKTDSSIISEEDKKSYRLYECQNEDGRSYEKFMPFEIRTFYNMSKGVYEYINKRNKNLVDTFKACFPDHAFFAVSAYGCNPHDSEKNMNPYHVTLPFMWMLALKNYIEIQSVVTHKSLFRKATSEEMIQTLDCFDEKEQEAIIANLCMNKSL